MALIIRSTLDNKWKIPSTTASDNNNSISKQWNWWKMFKSFQGCCSHSMPTPLYPLYYPWWLIQTTVISVYCLIIIILWQPYRTSLTVLVVWLIAKICKYIYLWCSWVENRLHYQHKSNEKLIRNKNEIQTNQNRSFPFPFLFPSHPDQLVANGSFISICQILPPKK